VGHRAGLAVRLLEDVDKLTHGPAFAFVITRTGWAIAGRNSRVIKGGDPDAEREQMTGARTPGKACGEIRHHGSQAGRLQLADRKIYLKRPRLRPESEDSCL